MGFDENNTDDMPVPEKDTDGGGNRWTADEGRNREPETIKVEPIKEEPIKEEPKKNGMAIASMVMGILSLVSCCCCGIGVIFGALGIIFALLSRGEEPMDSAAKAGLIMSAAGIAFSVFAALLLVIVNAASALPEVILQ